MKMQKLMIAVCLAAGAVATGEAANAVTRIFRTPRWTKAHTGMLDADPIDAGKWIWHPEDANPRKAPDGGTFLRFRCEFERIGEETLRFDVCADERFVLRLDGRVIARGPVRGSVDHWFFQSYEVRLDPGRHVMDALVWRLGDEAPLAQLSWCGGFVLKAEGAYHRTLSTGYWADWKVGFVKGTRPRPADAARKEAFGVGCCFDVRGTRADFEEPAAWVGTIRPDAWVRRPLWKGHGAGGSREDGWQLYPSECDDQTESFAAPGEFRAAKSAASGAALAASYAAEDADSAWVGGLNELLRRGRRLTVPSHTTVSAIWDLGVYRSGYPELEADGGRGAEIRWGWTESLLTPSATKGDRAAFAGKSFAGLTDAFFPDGRKGAAFSIPWWRCGRWCRIEVKTGDEPLDITRLGIVETRQPLEDEGSFACDDPTIGAVRDICVRGMQMCCHETLFDCPYYEQQQYPGDSSVQLCALTAMSRDDRIVRRTIEAYDWARLTDGLVPFSFPARDRQEGATYTLCYLMTYGDYALWHANAGWLKARLPGIRHSLNGLSLYENADGLLVGLPGWCFVDWVPKWSKEHRGCAPDGETGSRNPSAVNNLLYLNALRAAALVERAVGDAAMEAYWTARARRLSRAIADRFWDERRGLVADTLDRTSFSEHAQALAILGDALDAEKAKRAFEGLVSSDDLSRCTVYFSHHLFKTYFKFGRGDLFLKRLDLWRGYVKMNLTTPLEAPGDNARSDCHAWGSHPLFHLHAGVAGVRPSAPLFRRVRVSPSPGDLRRVKAKVPHPDGFVEVDLRFDRGEAHGTVTTPVPGDFEWKGRTVGLKAGANVL